MILTIIFIFMILLGLVFIRIGDKTDTDLCGSVLAMSGFCFLVVAVIIIIISHTCADYIINKNQINYEGLCKKYEIVKSEYEDVSKSEVIEHITEWNMKVYKTKYWTENPWTNWFNPKEIADNLEYIQ